MSTPPASTDQSNADPRTPYHEHYHGLPEGSYTDEKLRHASAHHLHMTSRRYFIGPIPEGWLHGNRKSWYRRRLRFRNYTSQSLSFSVDPVASYYRQQPSQGSETEQESVPPAEEEVALTLTDTSEGAPEQAEDAEQESEEEPSGEMRILSHPTTEAENIDPPPEPEDEDSDSTPKASTRGRSEVYANTGASSSYVTAREDTTSLPSTADTDQTSSTVHIKGLAPGQPVESSEDLDTAGPSETDGLSRKRSPTTSPSEADSTTRLLKSKSKGKSKVKSKASRITLEQQEPQQEGDEEDTHGNINIHRSRFTKKVTRFNLDDNIIDKQQRLRSRIARTQNAVSATMPRRRKVQDGQIIKAEKMLVRIEETLQGELPADYNENDSLRMETRAVDKWREFLVVCRKSSLEHTPFVLQMYRTRVIPDIHHANSKTAAYYELRLNHKQTKANLYSTLDKTIVVWHPRRQGTKIYIIRPKSTAHAAEWYTFIRQVLGWRRPKSLPINVPELGVSLIFNHPFEQLETTDDSGHHSAILQRSDSDDKFAAATIIRCCMQLLEGQPEWTEVLKTWSKTEKMGLAWKRYDRLEWIFGANEQKMYGTIAMESSHELELRPRHHYPTVVKHWGRRDEEPLPIEGFLVRLTSQKGVHQRTSKMFFKRLYFFTQDHYFLFCRPAKAQPPAPPKLVEEDAGVPSARQILDEMPQSWDIDPYPLEGGSIAWLSSGNPEFVQRHDEEAYAQMQRNVHNVSHADGYIDLCRVQEVRNILRGASPADPNIDAGPAVEFDREAADSRQDDGATREFDDDRTFEMALDNGLVVRLQAHDTASRDQWVQRLGALVSYWRSRSAHDAAELKEVRARNLKLLDIDEEMESIVGQFAKKWEVKKAEASPHTHNMCALSGCRTIKMSGQLYRKPRRHATFSRCHVMLTEGHLLIFRSTLRRSNGVEIPHIHQELETSIDLRDCYIYSGLLAEDDLLYANQTFDSNNPGLHALPRVYLSTDRFTSRDEDTSITFVVWKPLKRNYFRAQEKLRGGETKSELRHVSTLGKHGRTIVFKARSRVEKDRWVLSIASEIDRLQEEKQEDIRIVSL
ncbi:hypothetical protein N7474_003690 [Penicillium riverlandense]|uniref:uncharacterized protein n=1 Tax=Penicillium riverlandense TaxID=1903569 RepID=UPI002548D371|nr:uncharacterized protein N7474_003690 [Penicillium riverlandense]KAJ5818099.1 hypothetical protein N7474_003690 [Penicillium riverlandense]